jgi:transglutaminase-like putative cysteine protease
MRAFILNPVLCRCVAFTFLISACLNPMRFGVNPRRIHFSLHVELLSEAYAETLDSLDPAVGVIGVPSVHSVQSVNGKKLSVRYSVFNYKPETLDNVLLQTTFANGITVTTASPTADSAGNTYRFHLGSLPPAGMATVTVELSLPNTTPSSIDNGAIVSAALDGRAVRAGGAAVRLSSTAVDESLLASTPGADVNDRYVLALAAKLNNDPLRIFQYVRDNTRFEAYQGALRGARGVIWSGAGNAIDRASLLVALLRVSGIPARYLRGSIPLADEQRLIRSMFPQIEGVVGVNDPGLTPSDPENDPTLLNEVADHFWVELNGGSGFTPADPSFSENTIGHVSGSAAGAALTAVPEELNQTVTLTLSAEFYSQATAAFGFASPLGITPQLQATFRTVDVVGRPITIGNQLSNGALPNPVFAYTTTTYTPYFVVDQNDSNVMDDQSIEGTPYTETLTSFPLGSNVLTGLFLQIDTKKPDGSVTTSQRTLLDRIGYDIRQNGGSPNIDVNGPPPIGPADVTVLNIAVSDQFQYLVESRSPYLEHVRNVTADLQNQLDAMGNAPLSDNPVFAEQASKKLLEANIVTA